MGFRVGVEGLGFSDSGLGFWLRLTTSRAAAISLKNTLGQSICNTDLWGVQLANAMRKDMAE